MTLYGVMQAVLSVIFKLGFAIKVSGVENIPKTGGAVIASNHISLLDPPVLGVALPRRVHFMAKKELFANPVFAWVIEKLNAFPVQRGTADRVAIRKALSLLEQQELLGIFPEGTRSKTGALGNPEPGVALIAAKAGAPIVPTAIFGTNQVGKCGFRLPRFAVAFGPPIYPEPGKTDRDSLEILSQSMMKEIGRLLTEGNCQQ
ncbi:MAG: 1-acyl-sn-glycerol-3-phosphate acyltransferase [Anaerosporomusa subterranea]|nr:1-acyl-sn-glycerol-3-phosphate acyltransferase [Anaerosporomusa subterranea]